GGGGDTDGVGARQSLHVEAGGEYRALVAAGTDRIAALDIEAALVGQAIIQDITLRLQLIGKGEFGGSPSSGRRLNRREYDRRESGTYRKIRTEQRVIHPLHKLRVARNVLECEAIARMPRRGVDQLIVISQRFRCRQILLHRIEALALRSGQLRARKGSAGAAGRIAGDQFLNTAVDV